MFLKDVVPLVVENLDPTDELHFAYTCKELSEWILQDDGFWLRALKKYQPYPTVLPSTLPPKQRFVFFVIISAKTLSS